MNVIDLFAGAGGFSLGAVRAGFKVVSAVEIDKFAINSHKLNFPKCTHIQKDISSLNADELLHESGYADNDIDGIIGGPPCQGFSFIGKSNAKDERNNLFLDFFRLVSTVSPKFFIAENVPGILREKYAITRNTAYTFVKKKYVLLQPFSLAANDYGASTTRTRVFFIGIRKDVSTKLFDQYIFLPKKHISTPNVKTILYGLPKQVPAKMGNNHMHWHKIKPFKDIVLNKLFQSKIPSSVGDNEAISRLLEFNEVSGCYGTIHKPEIIRRFATIKPGKMDHISKSRRLDPEGYCPTLRAGTDNTKGSYQAVRPIHFSEHRVITPREAARLQGFPDWYQFHTTIWHSFRQIGNSISPILAESLLKSIKKIL